MSKLLQNKIFKITSLNIEVHTYFPKTVEKYKFLVQKYFIIKYRCFLGRMFMCTRTDIQPRFH